MGADINIKLNIRATTEPSGVALGKQGRCVQKSDGDDDDGHRHDDDGLLPPPPTMMPATLMKNYENLDYSHMKELALLIIKDKIKKNIISIVIIPSWSEKCEHDVAVVEYIEAKRDQFDSEKHLLQIRTSLEKS